MYTVLLDSSNVNLSVGLAKNDSLLKEISYEAWQQQSEYMIVELNKLLNEFNVNYQDVDSIMVAVGPGSYTGVRIAITIAKTMALACNAKVYPVSSLWIQKDCQNPSICLINARSGRSYVGLYEGNKIIKSDSIWKNDEVIKFINENPNYSVCGNTKYLGLDGKEVSVIEGMLSLKKDITPIDNYLALKPVYMSD